jgi:hypothetical protein
MNKIIGKILSHFGFPYCKTCGRRQLFIYSHGFVDARVYGCLKCDDLSQYDWEKIIERYVVYEDSDPDQTLCHERIGSKLHIRSNCRHFDTKGDLFKEN